jgi:hypothetical protein
MMRWMKGCHDFMENEICHVMYVHGGLVRRRDDDDTGLYEIDSNCIYTVSRRFQPLPLSTL